MHDQSQPPGSLQHQAGVRNRLLEWLRRFRPGPGTYVSAFCIGAALAEAICGATTPEAGLATLAAALGVDLLADLIGDWRPSPGQASESAAEEIAEMVQARLARGEGLAAARAMLQHMDALRLAFEAWQREEDDRWVWLINELAEQPELIADQTAAKLLPRLATIEDRLACIRNLIEAQPRSPVAPPPTALRVFISGTMEDLQPERKAVDEAISRLLFRPVRAETMGSQPQPSRDAILRAVQECDIYLGVYGGRYGWQIPDLGVSVTELEFDEARKLGKPTLIYVKGGINPEERQAAFLRRVQDFDAGYFRRPRFFSPEELASWVQQDLSLLLAEWVRDPDRVLRRQLARDYAFEVSQRFQEWRSTYVALSARADLVPRPRETVGRSEPTFRRSEFLPVGARLDYHDVPAPEAQSKTYDDVRQALEEAGDAVLLGEAGVGKSTTLWRLMLDQAERATEDPDALLPVLIPLGGYDGRTEVLDLVRSQLQRARIEVARDQYEPLLAHRRLASRLEEELAHGRLALFFDGLNEIPQDCRSLALAKLGRFRIEHPGNRCVFTCRELDYTSHLPLPEVHLEPLGDGAIPSFVRAYLPSKADSLVEHLGRDRSLWEIGRNPYMLSIMTLIYAQEGGLPANRAALFGRFVSSLLLRERKGQPDRFRVTRRTPRAEQWAPWVESLALRWSPLQEWLARPETFRLGDGTLANLTVSERQTLSLEAGLLVMALAEFAYHMGVAGLFGATAPQSFIESHLPSQMQLGGRRTMLDGERLVHLARSAGLLDQTLEGIQFTHQLLQEYFAAIYLNTLGLESPQVLECLHYDAWDEAIALLAGMGEEADGLVERLLPLTPFLAARCAAVAVNGLKQDLARRLVDILALEVMDESSAWREEALQALGMTGLKESLPVICSAASTEATHIRLAATRSLGATHLAEAVPALIQRMQDTEASVRWASVEALRSIQSKDAIPALLDLATHGQTFVRWAAVEALAGMRAREAIPVLVERLGDEDRHIQATAILAIGGLQARGAIPALVERLRDQEAIVRHAAAETLESLQAEAAAPSLADWPTDEVVLQLHVELGMLTPERTVRPILLNWLRRRESAWRAATQQLAHMGDVGRQRAISALLDRLQSATFMVRIDAVRDLQRLQAEEAIPTLLCWLGDRRTLVRWSAVIALEELRAKQAVPALLERLRDEDVYVRQAAAHALATLRAKEAIPTLVAQSRGEDFRVQMEIASALGVLQGEEAIPMLLNWLDKDDPNMRWAAVHVLTELKAEGAIGVLVQRLCDKYRDVREAAARALEVFKAAETVPLLVLLGVAGRTEAWDALAQMRQETVAGVLQALTQHPNIKVRAAALRASEKARQAAGLPRLGRWRQIYTTRSSLWTLLRQAEDARAFIPDWLLAVMIQAECLRRLGCAAAALTVLDRCLANVGQGTCPRDTHHLLALEKAKCLSVLGRREEALAASRALREQLKDDAGLLRHVADLCAWLGEPEEAGALYAQCVDLDKHPAADSEPWHSTTFGRRGQLALAQGRFTEALTAFQEAAARDSHEVAWQFNVAFAQLGLAEPDAMAIFEAALERSQLHEQVESALRDLRLLERARPDLSLLEEVRNQIEKRRDCLTRLAEQELRGYLAFLNQRSP